VAAVCEALERQGGGVFTIGQFSRITGLSIKTIRLYHEKGLLEPARVDGGTGYRYYDNRSVEKARAVVYLRELEFPLGDIKEILDNFQEDAQLLAFLERQRDVIRQKMLRLDKAAHSLEQIIKNEREARAMVEKSPLTVGEKELPEVLVAGLRWKGRYDETGRAVQQVAKQAGRHIRGKAMNLYYDGEFREEDADIETCFPVSGMEASGKIAVHRLAGGKCVFVVHRGPYDQIGRSYAKLIEYVQEKGYEVDPPSREVYLKGPGMIFRGNPRNYLTEIQLLVRGGGTPGAA
jgi:DNA-binding transcriptional MerR regulator